MTQEANQPANQGVSQPAAQPQAPAQPTSNFSIPTEYQDRGWAEKIKSSDDLFKAYDNAQSLIGKRPAGIPSQDASDAEWDNFYKAVGRPDDAKYDFKDPEGLPEGFDTSSFKEQASQILHKAGLSQKQADLVYNEYLKLELAGIGQKQEQSKAQQAELDKQYEALTKEHFGDNAAEYEEAFKREFERHVPQSLKPTLQKLTDMPDVLTALMAYTKGKQGEINQYKPEGKLTTGNQTQGQSIEDVRRELATLRTSKEARDFTSPKNKEVKERIGALQSIVDGYYNRKQS